MFDSWTRKPPSFAARARSTEWASPRPSAPPTERTVRLPWFTRSPAGGTSPRCSASAWAIPECKGCARIYDMFTFAFPYSRDADRDSQGVVRRGDLYRGARGRNRARARGGSPPPPHARRPQMMDLVYLGLGIVFFALTWALVHGFERLRNR